MSKCLCSCWEKTHIVCLPFSFEIFIFSNFHIVVHWQFIVYSTAKGAKIQNTNSAILSPETILSILGKESALLNLDSAYRFFCGPLFCHNSAKSNVWMSKKCLNLCYVFVSCLSFCIYFITNHSFFFNFNQMMAHTFVNITF